MFAKNERIGNVQRNRLAVFYLLGVTTLLAPPQLAKMTGWDGMLSLLLGGIASFLYLLILEQLKANPVGNKLCAGLVLVIATVQGAYVSYVLSDLLVTQLKLVQPKWLVLGLLIVLVFFTVKSGTESRARVFQILYPVMLIPLLIMMFLAIGDVKAVYVGPFFSHSPWDVLRGAYLVFSFFTTLFYVRLDGNLVSGKQHGVFGSFFFAFAILVVFYGILLGNFGENSLSAMEYPSITLMSTIQFDGFFVKRLDALMVGVWFGTLYALLAVSVFYSARMLSTIRKKISHSTFWVSAAVFAIGFLWQQQEGWINMMGTYTRWVSTPILLLIPVVLWVLQITGCAMTELEHRGFPLLIAVSKEQEQVLVTYVFQDEVLQGEGDSYEEAVNAIVQSYNRKLDYDHMKILLLEEAVPGDEVLYKEILETTEKSLMMPRNVYVCTTEDALALLEEKKVDLGNYLEEYLQAHKEELHLYTLGDLLDEQKNKRYVIILPQVG